MITEPISLTALSMGLPLGLDSLLGLSAASKAQLAGTAARPGRGSGATPGQNAPASAGTTARAATFLNSAAARPRTTGGAGNAQGLVPVSIVPAPAAPGDWLSLLPLQSPASNGVTGITPPWHPAQRQGAGQVINLGTGAGGSAPAATANRGAITPLKVPAPGSSGSNQAASSALLAAASSASQPTVPPTPNPGAGSPEPGASPPPHAGAPPSAIPPQPPPPASSGSSSGGGINPNIDPTIGNSSGASLGSFPYFPVYVVDYTQGEVMFPGAYQLATFNKFVDLRAQVENTTVSSISWNTTNLTLVNHVSGTTGYDLTFTWGNGSVNPAPSVNSVTLSVTDTNSHTETFTYDFLVPAGSSSGMSGGGDPTWPGSLPPDLVQPQAPAFDSHNVSVDATSGALNTDINLPSYNPNVPALALTYNSLTADPRPIVDIPHALSSSLTLPSQDSGQLSVSTTGGTTVYTGSTWYDNTSQLMPGDIQQMALQANMTGQSTGRYNDTATVVDYRGTMTTTTLTGTMTVLNQSSSAIGDGWTVSGLEKITPASGGVILDLGSGGRSLWFSGSFGSGGGTFTDPPGEFSTLLENSGGTFTRTLTDGTQISFDSGGHETATIDTNGLHITYAYSSGNLSTITDPYGNITTFSYSGGYLQSIKDPAGRYTTFTHSGSNLTGATLPDNSTWGYAYDGSGRLTQVTDPNSKTVTVAYDSAQRASTITRPDSSTEEFFPGQEAGFTNSGTSGGGTAAVLLATSASTYTDPNSNTTSVLPDWNGQGLTNVAVDPLGNVASFDRIGSGASMGLATVTIDRLNRIDKYTYDSKGNITQHTYPDLNYDQYSYNSFAEVTQFTDANNHVYTYDYDSHGNLTVTQDPMGNLTTMTYTGDGMLATLKDANGHTTSIQYDSQDRATTVLNPDGTKILYGYNNQGNITSVTDQRSNTTTYSYDAMNRETGMTDPLTNRTTFVYDSGGNMIVEQDPTPSGQIARTTTISYDAMNRAVTVTAPLSRVTVYGYDSGGNLIKITDPMSRITSISYDALNRPTVVTAPLTASANAVTTTTYDAEGQVIQVADPLGRITTTTYNDRGWVATVEDGLGNLTTYAYTPTGKQSTVTSPGHSGGSTESFFYDKDDRLTTYTDANNHTATYGYDGVGNMTGMTDANGHATQYAYDTMNRLTTVTDALGHTTVYGYDSGGNQQTVKDALGNVTTTLYDADNRATTIVDPLGNTTTMAYDAAGRMTTLTDPLGNHTTWGYDSADRLTTMTDPLGNTATYLYNYDDQLIASTDRDGRVVTYSYDSGGQETGETWYSASGGVTNLVTLTYDADNELTKITDNYATLSFTYDSGGNQLTDSTSGPGSHQPSVTLTSGYDAYHDRTSLTDNITGNVGVTTFQYDPAFRLTTISASYNGSAGPQVVLGYDPGNRETSISRTIGGSGTSVNTSIVYDPANRVGTITDQTGTGTALSTYVYGYDNANRVTTEVNAEGTVTYGYDSGGELLTARGSRTENYSYDSGGNRNMTGYTTGTGNELSSGGGYTFTYDKEGNTIGETQLSTHDVWTFGYDDRNRMTSAVEKNSGGTTLEQVTYTYDALDHRIGVDTNGTQMWTVYDGQGADANPYADFNGSGTLLTRYVSGPAVDELFARTSSGGTTAWYLADRLGSVRDIVSTSGTSIDHVVYDSYGNILSESSGGSNGDRFKFTGMEWDAAIGQYYDHARWYGPVVGRFGQLDPLGFRAGDPNEYRYVHGSPGNATDPSGLQVPLGRGWGNFPGPGDAPWNIPPRPGGPMAYPSGKPYPSSPKWAPDLNANKEQWKWWRDWMPRYRAWYRALQEHQAKQDEAMWAGIELQVQVQDADVEELQRQYAEQQAELANKLFEVEKWMFEQAQQWVRQILAGEHPSMVLPQPSQEPNPVVGPGVVGVDGNPVAGGRPGGGGNGPG